MSHLYEIPKSWNWTTLNEVFLIERGGSPRPIKSFITDADDGINWIKIGDVKKGQKYVESTQEKIKPEGLKKSRLVIEGDFILSNSMSFGRPYIVKTKGAIHDGWLVFRDVTKVLDKDFFYYLLSSTYIYQQFSLNASGSTVKNLNIEIVKQTNISLPPLNEQKRIVTKIEKLFLNLDKSDQHLIHLEKQLKRYRQSVLKSAFEGQLTREWRENQIDIESTDQLLEKVKAERIEYIEQEIREKFKDKTEKWIIDKVKKEVTKFDNGLKNIENIDIPFNIPNGWEWKLIQESTLKIHYGYTASSSNDIDGPKLLRITDIQNNKVNWASVPSCIISDEEAKKYLLSDNDIVFARTGATVGKSFLIKDIPIDSVFASYLIRLIPSQNMNSEYIYKFFQSPVYWNQIRESESGIGQPNVNAEKLSNLIFPIPSLLEQAELVKEIDKHLSIIDKLETVVQKSIKESKRLRQSILKQAFEGKLVEQDPSDESATVLLEKIAKAKEEYKKEMKKGKKQ